MKWLCSYNINNFIHVPFKETTYMRLFQNNLWKGIHVYFNALKDIHETSDFAWKTQNLLYGL